MPYKKYARKGKLRRGRRKPWYRRKYSPYELAMRAWKATKYLRGLVNSEMFTHEVASSTTVDDAGTVISLNAIAQGDGEGGRTGNSILCKGIFGRIACRMNASATDSFVRIIFFRDTQQRSDTAPSVIDVLQSLSYLAPLNDQQKGRFTILKDWTVALNSLKTSTTVSKLNIPMMSHIRFNGSASTDIEKNGLYMLFIANNTTNLSTVFYNLRIRYHDN